MMSPRYVSVLVQGLGQYTDTAHQGQEVCVVNDILIVRETRPTSCIVDRISCPFVNTTSQSTSQICRFPDESLGHCATTSDFSGYNVIYSILIFYFTQVSRNPYS